MSIYTRAYILIILILLQSFSVMFLTNHLIINFIGNTFENYQYPYFMVIVLNIVGISAIICIFYILKLLKAEKESILKVNNSSEVIDALHAQKHDFMNHLNLISGMLQLEKSKEALKYIFKVCNRVDEVFSVTNIKNIEIAAILSRKCVIAESKGINVELDITTSLENLTIDSMDLCKVMFNLIDNAIYELENSNEEEKLLTIDMQEHEDMGIVAIGNSFPILSDKLYDKVFEKRYSTKSGEEHGYGLSIVKQIIEKNKGTISVESYKGVGTIFTVFLPLKKNTVQSL
ncbi:GHKL domain-containing protein [Lutibacter sp. B2]|nr:GHKL domain-containing protein [Lutibacter sp. B2]